MKAVEVCFPEDELIEKEVESNKSSFQLPTMKTFQKLIAKKPIVKLESSPNQEEEVERNGCQC